MSIKFLKRPLSFLIQHNILNKCAYNVIRTFSDKNDDIIENKISDNNNIESNETIQENKDEKPDQENDKPKIKIPRIYTKTGDKGTTALFTGERRPKYDIVFDALGDIDELSSHLGMALEFIAESWQVENFKEISESLFSIQCALQDVNSCIATPINAASDAHVARTEFNGELISELEEMIDKYTMELPPLKNFILPSGGKTSCSLHISRAVCRRAERKVSTLLLNEAIPNDVAKYVNRLSDYLFTICRYTSMMEGREEVIYRRPKTKKKMEEEKVNNNNEDEVD